MVIVFLLSRSGHRQDANKFNGEPLKGNINQRRIISHCTWRPRLLASQPDLLPDFGQLGPDGLQKYRFEEIAAWGYPDGLFASDYDIVSDTSKARRFGFHELVDTEEMFLRMFSDFRRDQIIP